MIRVFVAFPLPLNWTESFMTISKMNSSLEKFRWIPSENLHITLFFIGEIEEKDLEQIAKKLNIVFRDHQAIHLFFESIELRGKKNNPSMLWGKFRESESFISLAEKIYQSVKDLMTVEIVHKDPVPHCTLARIKPRAENNLLKTEFILQSTDLHVDAAELWKTIKYKEGVKYERLLHWNFNRE